jgi:hypothetical protein
MTAIQEREAEDYRGLFGLWAAVLLQAFKDFHHAGESSQACRNKRNAKVWIESPSEDFGSFLWICDLFSLDAGLVRARIRNRGFELTPIGRCNPRDEQGFDYVAFSEPEAIAISE